MSTIPLLICCFSGHQQLFFFLSLSLSLSLSHTHTHTLSLSLSHTHTHSLIHAHKHTHSLAVSVSHFILPPSLLPPSLPPSLLPPSRSPPLSLSLSPKQAAKSAGRDDKKKETYSDTNETYLDAKETCAGEGLDVGAWSVGDAVTSVGDGVRRRIRECHMASVGDDVSASSVVDKVEALAWLYVSC